MSNRPTIAYLKAEPPKSLISAEMLNRFIVESDSEWFALFNGNEPDWVDRCENAVAEFDDSPHAAILMTAAGVPDGRLDDWQHYPARLASLLRAPESFALPIIRKSALSLPSPFSDVDAPIWDWMIRTTRDGTTIATFSAEMSPDPFDQDHDLRDLAPSCPGRKSDWLLNHLLSVEPEELVENIASAADGIALKAGLLQIHDYLDESHQQSQSIEGEGRHVSGDYWHGIMHRREPDYSNAKYWYRRVGRHPVFAPLSEHATEILSQCSAEQAASWQSRLVTSQGWDPFAFVDICQECAQSPDTDLRVAVKRIQACEMRLLLAQTFEDATG